MLTFPTLALVVTENQHVYGMKTYFLRNACVIKTVWYQELSVN